MTADEPTAARGSDAAARDYVRSEDMFKALHEAGLLPQYPNCSRVVIDIRVGEIVSMYVDQIPSGALLNLAPMMPAPKEYP